MLRPRDGSAARRWLHAGQTDVSDMLSAIVKVFCVASPPSLVNPWQNRMQKTGTGTGFVTRDERGERRIVTNAHVVTHSTFVEVRRHGSPKRFAARVVAEGHDCDLAVLAVDDDAFWGERGAENWLPLAGPDALSGAQLPFGGLPELRDEVTVLGFPTGGDNISITSGVVSRIELQEYVHSGALLLAMQIDAAINPGNSGGPVLLGREVVGVAFQNLGGAENIGYAIPMPVTRHFLRDAARVEAECAAEAAEEEKEEKERVVRRKKARGGLAEGAAAAADGGGGGGRSFTEGAASAAELRRPSTPAFCRLGIVCQHLESEAHRLSLGMGADLSGLLATKVAPLCDAAGAVAAAEAAVGAEAEAEAGAEGEAGAPAERAAKVAPGDVLLAIDGIELANNGTVPLRGGGGGGGDGGDGGDGSEQHERVSFQHLFCGKHDGDVARLRLLRGGGGGAGAGAVGATGGEGGEGEGGGAGVAVEVDVRLAQIPDLVPRHIYGEVAPQYLLFAGVVFQPLTRPYLWTFGDDWYNSAPQALVKYCDRVQVRRLKRRLKRRRLLATGYRAFSFSSTYSHSRLTALLPPLRPRAGARGRAGDPHQPDPRRRGEQRLPRHGRRAGRLRGRREGRAPAAPARAAARRDCARERQRQRRGRGRGRGRGGRQRIRADQA